MKRRKIIVIILVTLVIYINFIPFEQWIFRFDTPEEAIKFDYTAKVDNIKSKIEIDEFAYISYINNKGIMTGKHLKKDGRGWIPPIKKITIPNKIKNTFGYTIVSYIERGKSLITITNFSINEDNLIKNISDNIGTNFKNSSYVNDGYYRDWVGIIEKYPKDYKLYLDSEEIKL